MNDLDKKRKKLYISGNSSLGKNPPKTTPRIRPTKIQKVLERQIGFFVSVAISQPIYYVWIIAKVLAENNRANSKTDRF
jgi:hypothetical protein